MQHLNYAKGQAVFDSIFRDRTTTTETIIVVVQEPCIGLNGTPPTPPGFDIFTPNTTPLPPKSATDIRKNTNLRPRNPVTYRNSLKITVTIDNKPVDILDIYSPKRSLYIAKITNTIKILPDCYIAGDFNSHYLWCYNASSLLHNDLIRNYKTQVEKIAN